MLTLISSVQTKKTTKKPQLILNIEGFGVFGDGKTDDGHELRKLFEKALALNRLAKIVFQKDATYYIGKQENHLARGLFMEHVNNLIVEEDNCLSLVDPYRGPFELNCSKNVTIRDFQIDYSL